MIIVKLIGGLGNQMFQYAAGKALALHHSVPLLIDRLSLEEDTKGAYTKRYYELGCFNLSSSFATGNDLKSFSAQGSNRITRWLDRAIPSLKNKVTYYESGHRFHPGFFDLPKQAYLVGFWQSEKYFVKHAEQIRQEFTLRAPAPANIKDILTKIKTTNSTSLHVRRGDYVSLQSAADFHGTTELDYYRKAVEHIQTCRGISDIFVFSDDLEWCRQNITFNLPLTFVEQNNGAEWDMYLMSQCKNNIIANSSFSWWGAWLNANPDKVVAAPEYWFKGIKSETMDIVARGWNVIV